MLAFQIKKLRLYNSNKSLNTILEILGVIKKGTFGLGINDAIDFLVEMNGFRRMSIDSIANKLRYREKEYQTKHINYLKKVCRSIVAEPEKIPARTSKMRIL